METVTLDLKIEDQNPFGTTVEYWLEGTSKDALALLSLTIEKLLSEGMINFVAGSSLWSPHDWDEYKRRYLNPLPAETSLHISFKRAKVDQDWAGLLLRDLLFRQVTLLAGEEL